MTSENDLKYSVDYTPAAVNVSSQLDVRLQETRICVEIYSHMFTL